MREEWLAEQDRKRRLVASGYTAGMYIFVFLLAWGAGLLRPNELAEMPGSVLVSFAGDQPGGAPLGLEVAPERPASEPARPPAPAPEKAAPLAAAPAAVPAKAVAAAPPPPTPSDKGIPMPAEKQPPAPIPVEKSAPSRSFGSAVPASAPAGVAGGSGSVTFHGTEKGNAIDTVFGASSGTIGRSLYVPIYLYMPLPARVDDAVYQRIPSSVGDQGKIIFTAEARKSAFRIFYAQSGNVWTLKGTVPLAQRPSLWLMLEDADYDLAAADYKAAISNSSVILEFALSPVGSKTTPELLNISVVTSSGSKDIDEAVVFSFQQSSFFNKNAYAISGKFTYRFGK